jgi:hypothetical protein
MTQPAASLEPPEKVHLGLFDLCGEGMGWDVSRGESAPDLPSVAFPAGVAFLSPLTIFAAVIAGVLAAAAAEVAGGIVGRLPATMAAAVGVDFCVDGAGLGFEPAAA